MSGSHIRVDVLPIGTHDAYKQYKVDGEAWVEAKEGEPYRIKLQNIGTKRVWCKMYLEGQLIDQRSIASDQQQIRDYVTTNLVKQGRTHRQTRKQLVFSKPTIAEEDEDGTLDVHATGAQGQSELGCIRVDVYAIKKRKLSRHKGRCDVVVSEGEINNKVSTSVDAKSKKGAFKSTSKIGGTKAVKIVENYHYHKVCWGKKLESVYLRYGSVAMLLLMGVDKSHFMVQHNTQGSAAMIKPEVVDLTADDDERPARCVCGGRKIKRTWEAMSGARTATVSDGEVEALSPPTPKRVKTEAIAVD